jgi:Tol biopolymer transport system component
MPGTHHIGLQFSGTKKVTKMFPFQRLFPNSIFVLTFGVLSLGGQVTPQPAPGAKASKSGDWTIRAVVFSVGRLTVTNDSRVEIFVSNELHTKARRVAEGSDPDWSPDGSKIVFAAICDRGSKSEIYTVNSDGSGKKQLTQKKGGSGAGEPAWSPDGKKIAFTTFGTDSPPAGIYVMDEDGSNGRFATEGLSPRWSPDGHRLVFYRVSKSHRDRSSIWVANSDGTAANRLRTKTRCRGCRDGHRTARLYSRQIATVGLPSTLQTQMVAIFNGSYTQRILISYHHRFHLTVNNWL